MSTYSNSNSEMTSPFGLRRRHGAAVVAAVLACAAAACSGQAGHPATAAAPVSESTSLQKFVAQGKDASMTVLPAELMDKPWPQIGDVVGVMLEQRGMSKLEVTGDGFVPPAGATLDGTAGALGEHLKAHPVGTDYALFCEFMVSPEHAFTEVRTLIAAKDGTIVWTDSQAKGSAAFDKVKPHEPMDCCVIVSQRVGELLKLPEGNGDKGPEGRLAKSFREKAGLPASAEYEAMKPRQAELRKSASTSTLSVVQVHAGDKFDGAGVEHLAKLINEFGMIKASAGVDGPQIAAKMDMNEQKVLWGMARPFREWVKHNPPQTDYVLFADYLMNGSGVGGVHFAVCDRNGELVIVDFQNSHWPDFQAINPRSREDADRLVAKRLAGYLK